MSHDTLRKDREDIIKKNNYNGYGDIQSFTRPNDEYKITNISNPMIMETDKFIIMLSGKGGSSIINEVLTKNKLYNESNSYITNELMRATYGNFINTTIEIPKDENDIEENVREFVKVLRGKSKKDFIIVTRNPIHKFMSGVIQDIIFSVQTSPMLKHLVNTPSDTSNNIGGGDNLLLIRELLLPYFKGKIDKESNVASGHARLYNEYFMQLLTLHSKIDRNKLKIVDIDNPSHDLVEIIKRYYPDINETIKTSGYWTHRKKWQTVFRNFKDNIGTKDSWITNLIHYELNRDYSWYKILLKTYENNLWKNKK